MFAALLLDPRFAFLLLGALVIAAAIPIASAWVSILPEEHPPFRFHGSSKLGAPEDVSDHGRPDQRRDPFAIALLLCVTISYALKFPGLPEYPGLGTFPRVIPHDAFGWIKFGLVWFFAVVPGLAAAYSFFRPNFLRIPLIAAGVLVFFLWLLSSPLRAALAAVS
jgi:hypothetical protein